MINFCTKFHIPSCTWTVIAIKPKAKKNSCMPTILVPSLMNIVNWFTSLNGVTQTVQQSCQCGEQVTKSSRFQSSLCDKGHISNLRLFGVLRIKLGRN